jgi:hypothetical protein
LMLFTEFNRFMLIFRSLLLSVVPISRSVNGTQVFRVRDGSG